VKQGLVMIAGIAVVGASVYYKRESARNSTDYTDVLRYERMPWVGVSVDYRKEPLVAWKIISGPKMLELTGSGPVRTCMDEHLLLGDRFDAPLDAPQPTNIGEALDYCKVKTANK
jgi:hypothetical protein